jgi:hypothetical protein
MKELQYLNFPVSFLRERDLKAVFEQALKFCSYESMVLNKANKVYFEALSKEWGLTDESDLFTISKELYNENAKSIRCGVKLEMFRNYINISKDDLNLEFRGFCATKAILGKKTYSKTNLKHIFALMFGYNSFDEMPAETKIELSGIESTRSIKRILSKLEEKWHLNVYTIHSRGLYISYKLTSVNLILEVKKDKILTKNKQKLNEKKADALLSEFLNGINIDTD